jgi:hypothetical protein
LKPEEHIVVLGTLHIAWSVLLLVAATAASVLVALGVIAGGEDNAYVIVPLVLLVSSLCVVAAIVGIVGAIGVFRRRGWGRYVLMCMGAIWLLKVPVGTALGIYTFYVLTREPIVASFHNPAPEPTVA